MGGDSRGVEVAHESLTLGEAAQAELERQRILDFFERCLLGAGGLLAVAGVIAPFVVLGWVDGVVVVTALALVSGLFVGGLCVTAVRWYRWKSRWDW